MKVRSLVSATVFACVVLCTPVSLLAQTVTLGGSLSVASAEDFATRSFQDPWDMNERTDFGWFLHGADLPSPDLTNISFSNGIFSATTGNTPNVFLLETGNPFAARLGKTGDVYPLDANTYRMLAIRMNINGTVSARLGWNRNNLWDGTASLSNTFNTSAGWRTYFIDLPTLGVWSGPIGWSGLIRSLQFYPAYQSPFNLSIDWIRLVSLNPSLCRQVTWSNSGAVNLYLDTDVADNGNETLLASNITNSTGTSTVAACSTPGSGHNFYAGALAPGSYQVLVRSVAGGAFTRSASAYVVNAAPTLTVTAPSEEGSSDDFATQLGNPWDMDSLADVERFDHVTGQSITTISTETPGGAPLGNTRVLSATSTAAASGSVGDPQVALLWEGGANNGARIDPNRYRILTVEFGMPNRARHLAMNGGSIARMVWRVSGSVQECVSDDIIFSSRVGANVLDKFSVDMADRTVLPLESGAGLSQLGWVSGSSSTPGIDRFRLDPHEFSNPASFYVRRVKLAALETASGNYTIRWNASKGGTVTLYRDTDRDPSSGLTQIGSTSAGAGQGSFVWPVDAPAGPHYIYVVINDGSGNANAAYSRWPLISTGGPPPPSAPPNIRILQ